MKYAANRNASRIKAAIPRTRSPYSSMLPGWDSVEVTSAYAKWFTYAGFVALFLLGVFEILAHVYSVHETTLSTAAARREHGPRTFPRECFQDALKGKPSATVIVLYQPEDTEAYFFSFWVRLGFLQAGWKVPEDPSPIPANIPTMPFAQAGAPLIVRAGGGLGISLVTRSLEIKGGPKERFTDAGVPIPPEPDAATAFGALFMAFGKCGAHSLRASEDPGLPPDVFRLIIGSKD